MANARLELKLNGDMTSLQTSQSLRVTGTNWLLPSKTGGADEIEQTDIKIEVNGEDVTDQYLKPEE